MKINKNFLIHLIFIIIVFYLGPFILFYLNYPFLLIPFIVIITPILCFIITLSYSIKKNSTITFPILSIILHIPTIYIFYNESAFIHTFIYGIIIFIAFFIGKIINKSKYINKL